MMRWVLITLRQTGQISKLSQGLFVALNLYLKDEEYVNCKTKGLAFVHDFNCIL